MPQEKFIILSPAPDGVETVFSVGEPYQPDSSVLFYNGINQQHRLGDPWTETDPSTGEITIGFVAHAGDTLALRFIDTSPVLPETEIIELDATVELVDEIAATLDDVDDVSATLENVEELTATIDTDAELVATLDEIDTIAATIEVCD